MDGSRCAMSNPPNKKAKLASLAGTTCTTTTSTATRPPPYQLVEHQPVVQARAQDRKQLFPIPAPFDSGHLPVGDGHSIYYEQCGNPDGQPAVVLHGGPGGGLGPKERRFHDPKHYRIVVLDQRGSGKSTPYASLKNNTTANLVSDLEKLRLHLGIGSWQVLGGSWGSTLGLAYAQAHPGAVTALVMYGIFLCRRAEVQWFYQDGASRLFPDRWEIFRDEIPKPERHDMVAAYQRRLTSTDKQTRVCAARAWSHWEATTKALFPATGEEAQDEDPEDLKAVAMARIENHYFVNGAFLRDEQQLLDGVNIIRNIPCTIVQGRYDVVCPPTTAWDLHRAWPEASFYMVQDSGHTKGEPGTIHELVGATERYKT